MLKNHKYLLEKFEEHLFDKYTDYCEAHGKPPTEKGLLTFLIDHDLIPPVEIRKFAVKAEFGKFASNDSFTKTQTVNVIADLFNIPQRTVWNILRQKATKVGQKNRKQDA
ncbi:MAG: hypothetical protein AAFZ15_17665 [Bacteroidota bacterium]